MVQEGDLLWSPSEAFIRRSNLTRFADWLSSSHQRVFNDYAALRRWSVQDIEEFWASIWRWFDVQYDGTASRVTNGLPMPHTRWFPDARVNYAEHVLRHAQTADPGKVAFHIASEVSGATQVMTLHQLAGQVRCFSEKLRSMGVGPGDRVVAYLPNVPECAVAMLATVSIGAIWSSAAIDFGVRTVVDRFQQIEPKVLIAADGYRFNGKLFDRRDEVAEITRSLAPLRLLVWVPYAQSHPSVDGAIQQLQWAEMLEGPDVPWDSFHFERVSSEHPIWITFSSGTTGLPKPIVHSHVGVLVEHLKVMSLHLDLGPESVMLFYTTTGWMMWNLLVAALMTGACSVLYDGSPLHDGPECLWRLAQATGTTCFGSSPTFVQLMEKSGLHPGRQFDLAPLRNVVLSGAPSTPEIFAWFYRSVKQDLWVTSQSGGTEICSGLVGASPWLPVYAGEIQSPMLGMAVEVWDDDGQSVVDQVGELVVTRACPSMPLNFWNDSDGQRYKETYFEHFPGVWRHGDFMKLNARGGCYIYGRSDSTLNRHGVRIGSAEIYRVVEEMEEIADSLVVCCELSGGRFFMPLFLRLKEGYTLDSTLQARVAQRLRQLCSPRHVPDLMTAVAQVPYTLTGKKMEVPIRKILMGWPLENAANPDAMSNPSALEIYVEFARSHMPA